MTDAPAPVDRLALLAYKSLFPALYPTTPAGVARIAARRYIVVQSHVHGMYDTLDDDARAFLDEVSSDVSDPVAANEPDLRVWLLRCLVASAGPPPGLATSAIDEMDETALAATSRVAIGEGTTGDRALVEALSTHGGPPDTSDPGKDAAMSVGTPVLDVDVDTRNLPETFRKRKYLARIRELFEARDVNLTKATSLTHAAYVVGALLRDSYFDHRSPGFEDAFVEQFNEGYVRPETAGSEPLPFLEKKDIKEIRRVEVYLSVLGLLRQFKGGQAPTAQELAAVSDEVLERGPVNDNTAAKARSAFDDYVGQAPSYDTLELPPLVTEDSSQGVYEPTNIRACAMIGAANHLDRAGLMTAVDQAAQDWSDGVLPVGDSAGRLFDPYVWDSRERVDPSGRQIQYDRIRDLDEHLLRFCSAVSERERGLYLSEYLVGSSRDRRTPQPQDASVRKTARDLLGYTSLHGWAYTAFAARRMGNHIRTCVEIIENAEVQKAYGVQGPWQVVERVNAMSTGQAPNIAKELTLASTGKEIIDLLAAKAKDIAVNVSGIPLFPKSAPGTQNGAPGRSVFSVGEYLTLLGHVENWLAASAITDTQRFDAAQPREIPASSSLPAMGGFTAPDSNAIRDQLMQMVGSGQMPSVDQVSQLFGR